MEPTQTSPQPQRVRPRLERLRSDRAVAGVASGLARYLDVDVAWVRIAFVAGALFGGTGILAYLVGWIAMPEEGEQDSIVADKTRNFDNAGSWIGVGLIVLAAMIVVGNTGLIDGDLIFAGVLIVLGFLLYRGDIGGFQSKSDDDSSAGMPASEAVTPQVPVGTTERAADEATYASQQIVEPPTPVSPPAPPDPAFQPRPPRPRQRSALGRIALATVLITVGIMGVGQSTGWWEPAIRHYVGAFFLILGSALVIGALYGRARWLIAVGCIAAPLLLAAALLDVPLEGGFGDPRFAPETGSELESEYRLIAGEMVIDLTELELAEGEDYQIDASLVFGSLRFEVPEGLGVMVNAEMDAGEIRFDGNAVAQGVNNDRSVTYDGVGELVIDAHVGFGELVVDLVEEEK